MPSPSRTLRLVSLVAMLLLLLASCDDGGDDRPQCTPGSDPMPGCAIDDCQAGRNSCGGTVYACDQAGWVIELGTCDLSHPDAGFDAGGECIPGTEPIPECSQSACAAGVNACGGSIFGCDGSGHVVVIAVCDAFPPSADAATPPPKVDAGMMVPPPDAREAPPIDAGVNEPPAP